jgi:hypothetical protein
VARLSINREGDVAENLEEQQISASTVTVTVVVDGITAPRRLVVSVVTTVLRSYRPFELAKLSN